MTYIDDERFEVAHIDESDDWNLMISNITTADTGAYECQISATDKELRKEVYLNVKGKTFCYIHAMLSSFSLDPSLFILVCFSLYMYIYIKRIVLCVMS